jgi:hypothetical protein
MNFIEPALQILAWFGNGTFGPEKDGFIHSPILRLAAGILAKLSP